MTSEHWTDRLSEYMDGELDDGEREALELHLLECDECAELLAELRQVVAGTALLEDREPEGDLWPGIAGRLAPRHPSSATPTGRPADTLPLRPRRPAFEGRRVALTVPQLLAAGIALIVLSAGGAWVALSPGDTPPLATAASSTPGVGGAGGAGGAGGVDGRGDPAGAVPVTFTASYVAAVGELEAAFEEQRQRLDPETIRVVERNLAIIDAAIAEARDALEEDPASGFLNTHLANAMRRKVDLLRQATRIERTEI